VQAITRGELSQTKAGGFVNWRAEVPGDYIIGTVLGYDLAVVTQYGEKLPSPKRSGTSRIWLLMFNRMTLRNSMTIRPMQRRHFHK